MNVPRKVVQFWVGKLVDEDDASVLIWLLCDDGTLWTKLNFTDEPEMVSGMPPDAAS